MIKRKGYKFKLKLTGEQERQCRIFAGQARLVWNKALALQKQRLDDKEKRLGYGDLCKLITQWRNSDALEFLQEAPVHTQQQQLKDLDRAFKDAFDKKQPNKRFPVFKKKGKSLDSFRFPDPKQFTVDSANRKIKLPKLGIVRYRKTSKCRGQRLKIEGVPKQITVSRRGQDWFVSIQTELEIGDPKHPSVTAVGGDLGVKKFLALSDGTIIEPLNPGRNLAQRLAREQRKLARKVKFSNNWKKQQQKIAKLHIQIADQRHDFVHKVSNEISKNHAIIVLEDLRIVNMSASAKGNLENPGTRVKQKSGLNRAILDQGWGIFRELVEYKQAWRGGELKLVSPKNTSRTCPECGHVAKENRKTQALFLCEACGHTKNADVNAAINILRAAGHAVQVCGGISPKAPDETGTHKEAVYS